MASDPLLPPAPLPGTAAPHPFRYPYRSESEVQRARRLARILREQITGQVIPFWERCAINADGSGFWSSHRFDGSRLGDGAHSIVAIARLACSFASVAELTASRFWLDHAVAGGAQLLRYWREEETAWCWRVAPDGSVVDATIDAYGSSLAAYALATVGRVADRADLVDVAVRSFRYLWQHGREERYGGFWQRMSPDWTPTARCHRLDSHLRAMEACAALLAATGAAEWRNCWRDLTLLISARAFDPEFGCIRESFHPDWTEDLERTRGRVSVGHNLESAWFLGVSAPEVAEPGLDDISDRLLRFALEGGWIDGPGAVDYAAGAADPSLAAEDEARTAIESGQPASPKSAPRTTGLFRGEVVPGFESPAGPDESIDWWVQAEGLRAIGFRYRQSPHPQRLDRIEELWRGITRSFADPEFGDRYPTVDQGGPPVDATEDDDWKAAYHFTRSLVYAASYLDEEGAPGSAW